MALDGLKGVIDGFASLDVENEILIIVMANGDTLIDLQQEQMYEGVGGDGEFIRPFYSEDPFFKTPKAAFDYASWKQRITPNPKRPFDVPNLYINGFFYKSLVVIFSGATYSIQSKSNLGEKVFADHPNAEGLGPAKAAEFVQLITFPEFIKVINERTGLNIK